MEDGWVQKHCIYSARTKKRREVFKILVPNPAFPKADIQKRSHGGITQWLSGLRRTGSDPFVISHSTTLILTTRQHLCHRFSAPGGRCRNFKAPSTISAVIIIHSSDGIFCTNTPEMQRKPKVYKTCYQIGENVQVQMKWYRCYQISPISSWHKVMCLPVPFSVTQ